VRNSDTKVRHGHITKMGPAAVRLVLGEAAHVAQTKPPFVDAYESIRRRRGKQIATTAIARRLLAASFTSSSRWTPSSQLIGLPGELDALSALTLEAAESSE
jgi:transposase